MIYYLSPTGQYNPSNKKKRRKLRVPKSERMALFPEDLNLINQSVIKYPLGSNDMAGISVLAGELNLRGFNTMEILKRYLRPPKLNKMLTEEHEVRGLEYNEDPLLVGREPTEIDKIDTGIKGLYSDEDQSTKIKEMGDELDKGLKLQKVIVTQANTKIKVLDLKGNEVDLKKPVKVKEYSDLDVLARKAFLNQMANQPDPIKKAVKVEDPEQEIVKEMFVEVSKALNNCNKRALRMRALHAYEKIENPEDKRRVFYILVNGHLP